MAQNADAAIDPAQVSDFLARFSKLATDLAPAWEAEESLNKKRENHFDLFSLLIHSSREENTHSKWLQFLLDPHGKHGERALFLNTFLSMLHTQFPNRVPATVNKLDEISDWKIAREKSIPELKSKGKHSRPDLVISSKHAKILVAIENKISAPEGKNQLRDYNSWVRTQDPQYTNLCQLLFLTPKRTSADTKGTDYLSISYYKHIFSWLNLALPHIQQAMVRAAVQHYLNWIRYHLNEGKEKMDLEKEFAREFFSGKNLRNVLQFMDLNKQIEQKIISSAKNAYIPKFLTTLSARVQGFLNTNKYDEKWYIKELLDSKNSHMNINIKLQNPRTNFLRGISFYFHIEFNDKRECLGISDMSYGIYREVGSNMRSAFKSKWNSYLEKLREEESIEVYNDYWLAFKDILPTKRIFTHKNAVQQEFLEFLERNIDRLGKLLEAA